MGKNLISELQNRRETEIYEYDLDSEPELLFTFTKHCDFVFHLAGVNRPQNADEFMQGNFGFTAALLGCLKKNNNKAPILITSSIQAEFNNPYGKSKKEAENLMLSYGRETNAKVLIYRLPNVFGKWCKPDYNSAVATFCNNVARNLPIQVNDPEAVINLVYIDDVVNEFINDLNGKENKSLPFCRVETEYYKKLGVIADLINSFKGSRINFSIPDMSDALQKNFTAHF